MFIWEYTIPGLSYSEKFLNFHLAIYKPGMRSGTFSHFELSFEECSHFYFYVIFKGSANWKQAKLILSYFPQKNVPLCHIQACEVSDQTEMCQKVKGTENRDLRNVIPQLYSSRAMKMSFAELYSCTHDCVVKTE